ncbi:galactofuranose ABC transporter, permease protein YjfF [Catenuloplanes atrovinosus]|uniref:Simple sugar transport system permease protein n=1 Tax=Catenuloplanes atrovinosus TaxID=137266 RepID=A0AAE3YYA4_9ACTN|nr:galactofuranose ABC transporter, permease protein YjfF [Catenuloplanes atrovinosus]MDR7280638.1 simple sugar transport system permease protein [Catenuloplanes atrovinosus]
MTTLTTPTGVRLAKVFTGRQRYVPVLATATVLVLMWIGASLYFPAFGDLQVLLNVFKDNAFLLVLAVGMTFVILSGGIDLSVGSVLALSTMLCAWLVETHGWSPGVVIPLVMVIGALGGSGMGAIIHYFEVPPFIATLAGMFLARGLCYVISTDAISITHPFFTDTANTMVPLGDYRIDPSVVLSLIVVAIAFVTLHYTRFGRNVYAIGGSEQSALLMGLPVAATKVAVYAVSGLCAASAGVLYAFYTSAGYSNTGIGMELDAIAAVVIGGTLLTGGSGFVLGTVLGVLVFGVIQTITNFADLLSWWTRIVVGALLLLFIVLQRVIGARKT